MLSDHRPLSAVGLIAPHPGLLSCNRSGNTVLSATLAGVAATAWISLVRLSTPKCAFIPKYHTKFFTFQFKGSDCDLANLTLRFATRCSRRRERCHHAFDRRPRHTRLISGRRIPLHLPQAGMSADRRDDIGRTSGFSKTPTRGLTQPMRRQAAQTSLVAHLAEPICERAGQKWFPAPRGQKG